MSEAGTLERLVHHLVVALRPLDHAFRDPAAFRALMLELGWDAPGLPPSYVAVADAAADAALALDALADGAEVDEILAVVDKAGTVYRLIDGLADAPPGVDPGAFLPELARRLLEYLLARYLLAEATGWFATLEALGVIALEDHPPAGGRPGFTRIRFDWDEIPAILSDPASIPARVYGWGTDDLDFAKVAELLGELASALGLLSSLDRLSEEVSRALQAEATGPPERPASEGLTVVLFQAPVDDSVQEMGLLITELPAEGAALPGLVVLPEVPDGIVQRIELGEGWAFVLRAGTDLAHQLGVVVRPGGVSVRFPGAPGQPLPSAGFGFALVYDAAGPLVLFGQPARTRLELASVEVGGAVDVRAGDLELKLVAAVDGLALVLSTADLDGFLGSALGADELRISFPLGLTWSSRTGLDFLAGAGFEVSLYPHLDLHLLRFDRIDLGVRFVAGAGAPPALQVRAAVSLSGDLGPIAYSVDRLGVEMPVTFTDGNAGPFDVRLRPLWPTALGLVIDAGPVTGGGFALFDPDRGRYAGIVQLRVLDIGITAIALLDTKDEAGRDLPPPGFSFLLIVAVELPPIQLGYGFTLNGVGGLAGINRRLDTPALLAGVRSGAVDSILFPEDPIRQAPAIISNLSTIFPIAVGRYVFGPMAIIGWGTPTLISVELAIVVELPAPITIALLGQARIEIPEDAAILRLRVDVVGVLDFGRSLLAVDASLRDSYVAAFALAGDLAMRLDFGADPNFLLAVGGFNPHFDPPPSFPPLRRVSIALGMGENPRIGIEGYVALTTNSLQFGARAEVYAAAGGFSVHGWVSFDALFVFQPFSFRFDFSAGMSLNRGSRRIAGVTVHGTLTGPNPFHAWGKGCISVLFLSACVPFDATFGSRRAVTELPPADPWPLLATAIALRENWSTELPRGVAPGVSLQAPPGLDAPLLHPMGVATLRQKVVPLNRVLERFGQYSISGPDRFGVADVLVGGAPSGTWATVTDHFAPGDFENLSESEKVSRDSFERMDAGVRVGAAAVDAPEAALKTATVTYETKIVDTPWRSRDLPRFTPDRTVQLAQVTTGSTSGAMRAVGGRGRFARDVAREGAVVLEPERYAAATDDTLAPRADLAAPTTRGDAYLAVKHAPAAAARGVQVVPTHELEPS